MAMTAGGAETGRTRTALVTGGTGGMGRAIAGQLAADGFDVAVAYAGSIDLADSTVSEIKEQGRRGAAFAADIADEDEVSTLFDAIDDRFGHLDVVVHTAGINRPAALADLDLADFDDSRQHLPTSGAQWRSGIELRECTAAGLSCHAEAHEIRFEAIRILKQNPTTEHIPVWAVTCLNHRKDIERGLDAGCDGYVTKPIRRSEFVFRLLSLWDGPNRSSDDGFEADKPYGTDYWLS